MKRLVWCCLILFLVMTTMATANSFSQRRNSMEAADGSRNYSPNLPSNRVPAGVSANRDVLAESQLFLDCLNQCKRVKAGPELEECENYCWKKFPTR
jgi:hypothetical protein